jgi:hypothetical protein
VKFNSGRERGGEGKRGKERVIVVECGMWGVRCGFE